MRSLTYLHKKVLLGLASDTPRRERERKVSNKHLIEKEDKDKDKEQEQNGKGLSG